MPVGLKQALVPTDAKVLGTWADGKPAVTVRELGEGKAFAVRTPNSNGPTTSCCRSDR